MEKYQINFVFFFKKNWKTKISNKSFMNGPTLSVNINKQDLNCAKLER